MKTDLKGDFVKLIEDGFTVSSACKKLGIHRSTFYEWQGDDPMFGYKVTMARHTSVERVTDVAEQWMCKWVADGDRKSVYKWLEMNHPRFLKTKDRMTLITRGERKIEEEASVSPFSEHEIFQHIRAMRNTGFAFMVNIPPHIKPRYEAWLQKNDPALGNPDFKKFAEEREKEFDAAFNPIKTQELLNLAKKIEEDAKKKNPWQGNP